LSATPPTAAAATVPDCTAAHLSARIRVVAERHGQPDRDVQIVNTSFVPCTLRTTASSSGERPWGRHDQRRGTIDDRRDACPACAWLPADGSERRQLLRRCLCQAVTLVFVLPGTLGQVVAIPLSPTDTSGVPPCNGARVGWAHLDARVAHVGEHRSADLSRNAAPGLFLRIVAPKVAG